MNYFSGRRNLFLSSSFPQTSLLVLLTSYLVLSSTLFSQQRKIDSLLALLKTDKEDTNKVIHSFTLADKYTRIGRYDTALLLAKQALLLAQKLNFTKGEAQAYNNMGNVFNYKGDYHDALTNYKTSLQILETIRLPNGQIRYQAAIASSYNNLGNVYSNLGNYPEALKNYFASLKIKEKSGNKPGIAACLNNIGVVYKDQQNLDEALKKFQSCLNIVREISNKPGMALAYGNIATLYSDQAKYEEALANNISALKIYEELSDKQGVAQTYGNIGIIYFCRNEFDEAVKTQLRALKINEMIGDKAALALNHSNLGVCFRVLKRYNESAINFNEAIKLAGEIGRKEDLMHAYRGFMELDSSQGNFKSAFEHHKLYILYRDSLDNEQTRKKTIQSQMTYDFEKKEAVADAEHKKELESQKIISEEKNRKQKMILGFTVFGLLIVVVFAGFIFRSLRITRRQKTLIEEQKEEVQRQKHVVEEKQKEILDSIYYARRIQRALITNEKYFLKNLNKLNKN